MRTIGLDGKWQLCEQDLSCAGEDGLKRVNRTRRWLNARVPGEVHLDLIRAGRMPEPLVSTNAHACRWPETRSWWFRRTFKATRAFLQEERQQLVRKRRHAHGHPAARAHHHC